MKAMRIRKTVCFLTAALMLTLTACGGDTEPGSASSKGSKTASSGAPFVWSDDVAWTTLTPPVSDAAFSNPMKGFRGQYISSSNDYVSTIRDYIPWNAIEENASSTAADITDYVQTHFPDLEKKNLRLIPRVYLEWPVGDKKKNKRYWPTDMQEGDYWSDEFNARVVNLVKKMAEAWDNDPHIAAVEMGIYGYFGEQHLNNNPDGKPGSITEQAQKVLGDAFATYFKNKKVMIRYPWNFTNYDFGIYFDAFGVNQAMGGELSSVNQYRPNAWKTQMMSGEVAYDWGDYKASVGENPTETVTDPALRQNLIDWIRRLHVSSLGWVTNYTLSAEGATEGAAQIQKAFGYRYIIESFSYTANVTKDGSFSCEVTLRNDGSAPFYYNWPLTMVLLDPETHEPVYQHAFDFDIRTLLPGDKYDKNSHTYQTAPEAKTAKMELKLPQSLKGKGYLVALSINDPGCNRPAIRLACDNYFNGGYHPMGAVRFGGEATMATEFDKISQDITMTYSAK